MPNNAKLCFEVKTENLPPILHIQTPTQELLALPGIGSVPSSYYIPNISRRSMMQEFMSIFIHIPPKFHEILFWEKILCLIQVQTYTEDLNLTSD